MKTQTYRIFALVIVLSLFLSSCSSAFAPPTITPMSTSTFTPAPTSISTITPSPTLILPPTPEGLIIEEHELKYYPDISDDTLRFEVKTENTEEVLAKRKAYRDYEGQLLEYNNKLLEPFGYRIELTQKQSFGVSALYSIYKGNQLYLEKQLFGFSQVSVNDTKNNFAMNLDLSDGNYMLTNESLTKSHMGTDGIYYYPIYIENDLLSEKYKGDLTHIILGENVVYSGSFNNTLTISAKLGPWGYDNHWAMEMPYQSNNNGKWGDIIQDGKSLNESLGYEQSFGFETLNNMPFYFYQKDGKIGISFAQKEINTNYDEILHYFCCSAGLLNPGHSLNMVWFFARRDKTWYYVEAFTDIK